MLAQIRQILVGPAHITSYSTVQVPELPSNHLALGPEDTEYRTIPRVIFLLQDMTKMSTMLLKTTYFVSFINTSSLGASTAL